jgi:hypothetical protein
MEMTLIISKNSIFRCFIFQKNVAVNQHSAWNVNLL